MVLTGQKESVDKVLENIPVNPLPNKVFKNMGNLNLRMWEHHGALHNLLFLMVQLMEI